MATVRNAVARIEEELANARISQEKRTRVQSLLNAVSRQAGSVPTGVDNVASPFVKDDERNYWQYNDKETARPLQAAYVQTRPVNIAAAIEDGHRTPSGWYPRVELTFKQGNYVLVGDLDARAARKLAKELLEAAEMIDR